MRRAAITLVWFAWVSLSLTPFALVHAHVGADSHYVVVHGGHEHAADPPGSDAQGTGSEDPHDIDHDHDHDHDHDRDSPDLGDVDEHTVHHVTGQIVHYETVAAAPDTSSMTKIALVVPQFPSHLFAPALSVAPAVANDTEFIESHAHYHPPQRGPPSVPHAVN